jgi:hypothetical protein
VGNHNNKRKMLNNKKKTIKKAKIKIIRTNRIKKWRKRILRVELYQEENIRK